MSNDLLNRLLGMMEVPKSEQLRPPFTYPGNKVKSANIILEHLPYREKYIEPFGGSAAILLARRKSKLEVYNDLSSGLVAFYRCVRDQAKLNELCERLQLTVDSREEFYWAKDRIVTTQDEVERAACWYYTNTYSVSTLGRNFGRSVNSASQAGRIQQRLPLFQAIHDRISNVQIENQPYQDCLQDYDSLDAVFYIDPPYLDAYKGVYRHELSVQEHRNLISQIFSLKGFAAVSGFSNPLYDEQPWDRKFSWETRSTMQPMGEELSANKNTGNVKGVLQECLWIKE
ncbi:MAG: DNA adenine methylase [Proteobacteria bacterium]|jgi:DNA adenine methylase|nr:DNA adenine methylase [Pseudomonadota bacterium]